MCKSFLSLKHNSSSYRFTEGKTHDETQIYWNPLIMGLSIVEEQQFTDLMNWTRTFKRTDLTRYSWTSLSVNKKWRNCLKSSCPDTHMRNLFSFFPHGHSSKKRKGCGFTSHSIRLLKVPQYKISCMARAQESILLSGSLPYCPRGKSRFKVWIYIFDIAYV